MSIASGRVMTPPNLRFTVWYSCTAIAIWQLMSLADRLVPIPDLAVRSIPLLAAILFPLALRARAGNRLDLEAPLRRAANWNLPILALSVVLLVALLRVLEGPVLECTGVLSDCGDYIAMVGNLRFNADLVQNDVWDGYGTHYFMRVLPPLLVTGLVSTGIDVDTGFRIVSATAWLVFAITLYLVLLRSSDDPLGALAFTLLILGAHRHMTYHLRSVHHASDALTYPLSLGLVVFTLTNRWKLVFVVALLGIVTKQNLFALSTLCFTALLIRNPGWKPRLWIATLGLLTGVCYAGLSWYYQAGGNVARHALPSAGVEILAPLRFGLEQGLLELFVPLLPLLFLFGPATARFLKRNWFIAVYVGLAIAQPLIAYEITGGNVRRLALQGVWLLYLSVGLVALRQPIRDELKWILLAYAVTVFSHQHLDGRLVAAAVMLAVCVVSRLSDHPFQAGFSLSTAIPRGEKA